MIAISILDPVIIEPSGREVFRNLELSRCPLNLAMLLFIIEFSYVCVIMHNSYHLSLTLTLVYIKLVDT